MYFYHERGECDQSESESEPESDSDSGSGFGSVSRHNGHVSPPGSPRHLIDDEIIIFNCFYKIYSLFTYRSIHVLQK